MAQRQKSNAGPLLLGLAGIGVVGWILTSSKKASANEMIPQKPVKYASNPKYSWRYTTEPGDSITKIVGKIFDTGYIDEITPHEAELEAVNKNIRFYNADGSVIYFQPGVLMNIPRSWNSHIAQDGTFSNAILPLNPAGYQEGHW